MASKKIGLSVRTSSSKNVKTAGSLGVLMGPEGAGKTHSIIDLPIANTLVIGVDSGVKVLDIQGSGHRVIGVEDLATLDGVFEMLLNEKYAATVKDIVPALKIVVFDHISALSKLIMQSLQGQRNKLTPSLKEHGDSSAIMHTFINYFTKLAEKYTVVILALDSPQEVGRVDGQVIYKRYPAISQKPALTLVGNADWVGLLVSDGDKRAIQLRSSDNGFSAKTRFTAGEFPHDEWEENLATIIAKTYNVNPDAMTAKWNTDNQKYRKGELTLPDMPELEIDLSNSLLVTFAEGDIGTEGKKRKKEKNTEEE